LLKSFWAEAANDEYLRVQVLKIYADGFHLNPGILEASALKATGFSRPYFTYKLINGGKVCPLRY